MVIKIIITGKYTSSKNPNCDIFTPELLNPQVVRAISVSEVVSVAEWPEETHYTGVLGTYFLKLLAGDRCLHRDYAEINNLELFLWRNAKYGNSRINAQVNNAISRFVRAQEFISTKSTFTERLLLDTHKRLCPKIKQPGFRLKNIRLGDPKKNEFAFYAPPPMECANLLQNLLGFINNNDQNPLTKALVFYLQFIVLPAVYNDPPI